MAQVEHLGQVYSQNLEQVTISDGGVSLSILNYGATTRDWRVPLGGKSIPVVLGYSNPLTYLTAPYYLGAIVGRVSNRIGSASYTHAGKKHRLMANEGTNQLHGGSTGLSNVFWDIQPMEPSTVRLSYRSPEGENGFPGEVHFTVTIRLEGSLVTYDMTAITDKITPISLAQHNYYNLVGGGDIGSHQLRCAAPKFLQQDALGVSTGEVLSVEGTRCSFQQARSFQSADPSGQGIDNNLVFDETRGISNPVAEVTAPNSMKMRMWSDQPGAQLYSAANMPVHKGGLDGQIYGPLSGFCLEPQGFPNAINIPSFPSVMVTPNVPYKQRLQIEIGGI